MVSKSRAGVRTVDETDQRKGEYGQEQECDRDINHDADHSPPPRPWQNHNSECAGDGRNAEPGTSIDHSEAQRGQRNPNQNGHARNRQKQRNQHTQPLLRDVVHGPHLSIRVEYAGILSLMFRHCHRSARRPRGRSCADMGGKRTLGPPQVLRGAPTFDECDSPKNQAAAFHHQFLEYPRKAFRAPNLAPPVPAVVAV